MAAINPRNKQAERSAIEAIQVRLSFGFRQELSKVMRAQFRDAARQFEAGGAIQDAVFRHEPAIVSIYEKYYRRTLSTFAERLIGKCGRGPEVKKDMRSDVEAIVRRFIGANTAKQVQHVQSTTVDQISAIIQAGRLDDVATPTSISRSIFRVGEITTRVRAEVIARTEIHSAAGFASNESAKMLDMDLVKEWVSASDGRERDDHNNVASVGLNEKFNVGGESLDYPGDPSGSAEQIINCRCAAIYSPR
jgi:hypothetical protein